MNEAPHHVAQAVDETYMDRLDTGHDAKAEIAKAKITPTQTKMARYRAARG